MKKGIIIVFEGNDCSFKETNSRRLYEHLKERNDKVKYLDFPNYNDESAEAIYEFIRHGRPVITKEDLFDKLRAYSNNRDITFENENINKFLEDEDAILVLDRYIASNVMYNIIPYIHKYEDSLDWDNEVPDIIDKGINIELTNRPKEDYTLYMYNTVNNIAKILADKKNKDIHELNLELQTSVANSIVTEMVEYLYDKDDIKPSDIVKVYETIDGEDVILDRDTIFDNILNLVKKEFGGRINV